MCNVEYKIHKQEEAVEGNQGLWLRQANQLTNLKIVLRVGCALLVGNEICSVNTSKLIDYEKGWRSRSNTLIDLEQSCSNSQVYMRKKAHSLTYYSLLVLRGYVYTFQVISFKVKRSYLGILFPNP